MEIEKTLQPLYNATMSYRREPNEPAADFRERIRVIWELYVAPWPTKYHIRGRFLRKRLVSVAELEEMASALDYAAELGLIPPRHPPVTPPPVDLPFIIDGEKGRVEFYMRVEANKAGAPKFPPVNSYHPISDLVLKNRKYSAYVKTISEAGTGHAAAQFKLTSTFDKAGNLVMNYSDELKEGLEPGVATFYPWMEYEPWYYPEYPPEIDSAWRPVDLYTTYGTTMHDQRQRQLGKSLTPGRIDALVHHIMDNPKAYTLGYLISLVPQGPGGLAWLSMRDGFSNCVATSIIGILKADRALSDTRRERIEDWGASVLENGANYNDTDALASKLKMRIQFRDLAGKLLHEKQDKQGNPVYTNNHKVITLYQSDGHCSSGSPEFEPPSKLHTLCGPKILYPMPNETKAQTNQREKLNQDAQDKYIVQTIKENKLERAQIIGLEIISNGVLYRPIGLDKSLHSAAADLKIRPPITDEEHYRYHKDKKVDDILHIGGIQSLKLKAWLKGQGIKTLWPSSREAWKAATVEATVWTAEGARRDTAAALYDMRAAYLACDSRPEHAAGPSHEAALRFGFPRGGRSRKCIATTWEQVKDLAGFIRYKMIALAPTTPIAIAAHIAHHFQNRHSPIAIPVAIWLHEHGYISEYEILDVEYTDRIAGITFPNDRNLSVRLIGSCSYRDTTRTFYTSDPAEKDHFMELYSAHPKEVEDGFIISYPTNSVIGAKTKDHSHIRTYVLAYQAIAMWSAIEKLGDNLVGTSADSVLVKDPTAAEAVLPMQTGYAILWGEFRPKPMPVNQPCGSVGVPTKWKWEDNATTEVVTPAPAAASLARSITAYIEPGGFGKTTRALKEANESKRKAHLLVATNKAVIDATEKIKDMPNVTVSTYHKFFKISEENKQWTPAVMGKTGICHDIIIWDEFPVAGPTLLASVLPWMRNVSLTVVLCGDPLGQLQEFKDQQSGYAVMGLLDDLAVPVDTGEGVDWRAKDCPILQAAKKKSWCLSDEEQLISLREISTPLSFERVVEMWEPGDIIIEATNNVCNYIINPAVERRQSEKYGPQGRVDIVFRPKDKALRKEYGEKINGELKKVRAPIYPGFHYVPAAIGTIITTTRESAAIMDTDLWRPATTTTVHSIQGETVKRDKKIFICEENMPAPWCRNAIYVAMSRAELASQLYTFRITAEKQSYAADDY